MKFQNATSKQQAQDFVKNEKIIVEQREGGSAISGAPAWLIKNGRWRHEYELTQDKDDPNRYSVSAWCSDPSDIPFTVTFTTEQKPRGIVEVLSAGKGWRNRICKTDRTLKWTLPVITMASTLIQHGYCKA